MLQVFETAVPVLLAFLDKTSSKMAEDAIESNNNRTGGTVLKTVALMIAVAAVIIAKK